MCGIAGYWDKSEASPVTEELLRRMAKHMILRGPDDEGFYLDGTLGLAHRRLSIIDLSGGSQPMVSSDGNGVLVFNGEIFNYRELKHSLEQRGEVFRTASDTEVLLILLQREGIHALEQLNGFFAFAYYDRKERKLLTVRDRLGIKPLYIRETASGLAFASELAAFRELPDFDPDDISPEAAADFFAYQYVRGNRTIYRNVIKQSPAVWIEWDLATGGKRTGRFWEAHFEPKTDLDYRQAQDHLRDLITDSVARRLIADVPLGVFLSGGLDSAVIASAAARLPGGPLQCFSIGVADPAYDESSLAVQTAEHIKLTAARPLEHHIKTVEPCDFDLLPFLAEHFGEPYADASMLPTLLLSRFARSQVTAALSGDGADELFGGYDRYRAMDLMRFFRFIPENVWRTAARCIRPDAGERSAKGRLRRLMNTAALPESQQYRSIMTHNADAVLSLALAKSLNPDGEGTEGVSGQPRDRAETFMALDLADYLPGDVLRKVDVCSMAASLEVRSPFLDCRTVDFALSLPRSWKRTLSRRKRIVADTFADSLPEELRLRKKRGFGVPVAAWLRGAWQRHLQERLIDSAQLDPYFERGMREELVRSHVSGEADHAYLLFSLLMFSLFLEKNRKLQ